MGGRVCLKPLSARILKNLTSMLVEPASEVMSLSLQLCLQSYKKTISNSLQLISCVFILNSNSKVLNYKTDFRKALWLVRKSMFQDIFN